MVEEEDCYFVTLIVIRVIMQIIDMILIIRIITIIICREGPRVGRIVARLRRFSAQALAWGSFRSACAVLCFCVTGSAVHTSTHPGATLDVQIRTS